MRHQPGGRNPHAAMPRPANLPEAAAVSRLYLVGAEPARLPSRRRSMEEVVVMVAVVV